MKKFLFISTYLLLFTSCDQKESVVGEVVATVGEANLTREQIQQVMPPGLIADDSILWVRTYLESWIEQEVLFQFADKRGIGHSSETVSAFQDIKKRYVVGLLIDSLATEMNAEPSENELIQFYQTKPDEWIAGEPLFRVAYFFVSEGYDAKIVQSEFKSMNDWPVVSKKYALNTKTMTDSSGVILTNDQLGMLLKTVPGYLVPSRWTVVNTKSGDDKPIVLMLRILDLVKKGDRLPFRLAYQDIKTRLIVKNRQELIQQLTDSLRKTGNVQVNF